MRKVTLLLITILAYLATAGQSVLVRSNGNNTLSDGRIIVPKNLIIPRYADTIAANIAANLGIDSCGAIIYTYSPSTLWYRDCSGTKHWSQVSGGSSGTIDSIPELPPLFTTSNPTTAPVFVLSNTLQYKIFGRKASGSGVPSYLDADSSLIPDLHSEGYYNTKYLINWKLLGNASTDTSIHGIGTTDANDLVIKTNNTRKFTINTNGALGIGNPASYGTSGYILQTTGSGGAPAWVSASGISWGLTGNTGTTAGTNFIGTTDAVDAVFKANNSEQLRILSSGGISIPATTGSSNGVIFKGSNRFIHSFQLPGTATTLGENLFIGLKAGNFTMTGSSGGFGTRNLSIGDSTLYANTTGYRNVAIGVWNAATNTTGFENTTVGANAFQYNTTGRQNTALGAIALENNTTGLRNTAVGFSSMQFGTTAERNVAIGGRAMQNVSTGFANAALGFDALAYNSTADHNTAVGLDALYYSNGTHNTAVGDSTLWGLFGVQLHLGYKNVAIGSRAGYHLGDTYPNYASIFDTAVTFLGANASRDSSIPYTTSLKNMTVIGYNARGFASNQVILGNDDVTSTLLKGKVGIGTISPTSKLHISESGVSGSVTTSYIESIGAATTNRTLRLKAANAVNNIALAIESGEGDVGIGTLTPAATLHTVGTVRMASLGSASTDTTTYKPVGISSLGDVIPMTAWPQQVTASSTTTFTNKRWTARVGSTTSSATPTINTDNYDIYKLTALSTAITSMSSSLSGSPVDGDILEVQITDNGTARSITWGSSFVSSTVTLPTTTVISTTLTVILQYYTTSSYGNNKWVCVNYY